MRSYTARTLDDLVRIRDEFGSSCLFRGQTKHYGRGGKASIISSFARQKCHPPLMLEWSFYARELLRVLSGSNEQRSPLEMEQALLQHYGWRSFYIDLTSSIEVASWFASHKFLLRHTAGIIEDCFEEGLLTSSDSAEYRLSPGKGHLYAISKDELRKNRIGIHDLSRIRCEDTTARFIKQKAFLAGPVNALPESCLVAHIAGDGRIFDEMAKLGGFIGTQDLFPPREEDVFYKVFLSIPFTMLQKKDLFPVYIRSLPIPEYDYRIEKITDACVAYYKEEWYFSPNDPMLARESLATVFRVPDAVFFSDATSLSDEMPLLQGILGDHESIIIECGSIIRHPEFHDQSIYTKGIVVSRTEASLLSVSAITIDYPGSKLRSLRVDAGWHYKMYNGGTLVREKHPEDCPCNNPFKHHHHVAVLKIIEALIRDGYFVEKEERLFIHKSLC